MSVNDCFSIREVNVLSWLKIAEDVPSLVILYSFDFRIQRITVFEIDGEKNDYSSIGDVF